MNEFLSETPQPLDATDTAFTLLAAHVPLTLMLDLALAVDSQAIYRDEPGDVQWVPSLTG